MSTILRHQGLMKSLKHIMPHMELIKTSNFSTQCGTKGRQACLMKDR